MAAAEADIDDTVKRKRIRVSFNEMEFSSLFKSCLTVNPNVRHADKHEVQRPGPLNYQLRTLDFGEFGDN